MAQDPIGDGGDPGTVRPISDHDRALFAEFLVSARQRSGRSLEDIASTTKVPPRYLEALEEGRIERLPRGLYRRAIVRNYAMAVGLDPAVAIERFGGIFGSEAVLPEWHGSPAVAATSPRPGIETPRQTLSFSPVAAIRLPSARLLALSAHALPSLPKNQAQVSQLVLTAAVTVVVTVAATMVLDIGRAWRTKSTVPPTDVDARQPSGSGVAPMSAVETVRTTIPMAGASRAMTASSTSVATAAQLAEETDVANSLSSDPAEGAARLRITSQPAGARVTVNGIGWGVTPITIPHLSLGDKVVRVTKDGYVGQERHVQLDENGATSSVRLTLRPRQ